jgi:hypothetical protein
MVTPHTSKPERESWTTSVARDSRPRFATLRLREPVASQTASSSAVNHIGIAWITPAGSCVARTAISLDARSSRTSGSTKIAAAPDSRELDVGPFTRRTIRGCQGSSATIHQVNG